MLLFLWKVPFACERQSTRASPWHLRSILQLDMSGFIQAFVVLCLPLSQALWGAKAMWVGMNDVLCPASAFLSSSSLSVEGQVWGKLSLLFMSSLLQGRGPSNLRNVAFWCFGLKFSFFFFFFAYPGAKILYKIHYLECLYPEIIYS